MMKKLFAMILSLAMLLTMTVPAFAAEEIGMPDTVNKDPTALALAAGEKVDPLDALELALSHLNADIQDDGITASYNEDGMLQITQIVPQPATMALADDTGDEYVHFTTSTLLFADENGRAAKDYEYLYNVLYSQDVWSYTKYSVYALHTASYDARRAGDLGGIQVRLSYMTTYLEYGSSYKASKLTHDYEAAETGLGPVYYDTQEASTSQGNHNFNPGSMHWFTASQGTVGGYIKTYATLTVMGNTYTMSTNLGLVSAWELVRPSFS